MKTNNFVAAGLLAASVMFLAACGAVSKGIAADGSGAAQLVFPLASDATLKGGTFPNTEQLRQVKPGMTKAQLYQMFGPPHFHEGVFDVREWDYLFNFRTGQGDGYVTCEFKVLFDKHFIARSFYWKPASCRELIVSTTSTDTPVPLPTEPISLSADALFGFDKWHLAPAGRTALDDMLAEVKSASRVEAIQVVGYTDRIGTDAYNLELSSKRADSVRAYLVAHGVPAAAIIAQGRGEADLLVSCDKVRAAVLIACLAPDRRVEISGQLAVGD